MHALRKHPLLDCDLEEAALWYHLRSPAVAERLIDGTRDLLRHIAQHPFQFPKRIGEYRRARVGGFPHSLYFLADHETVQILALIHAARDAQAILAKRQDSGQY